MTIYSPKSHPFPCREPLEDAFNGVALALLIAERLVKEVTF